MLIPLGDNALVLYCKYDFTLYNIKSIFLDYEINIQVFNFYRVLKKNLTNYLTKFLGTSLEHYFVRIRPIC
jgi:hypothetical protein